MSLTRRGYAVGGICLLALVLGTVFGARALDAVVVPGAVALLVGGIGTKRMDHPTVTRSQPAPGFPGETRTISLDVEAEQASAARVRERASEGLAIPTGAIATGLPGRIEYECRLEARGERTLGPAFVTTTDPLGLFEREFRSARRTEVLVYPPVYQLADRTHLHLLAGEDPFAEDRGEFDSLREYAPGDPLRDVDWKASAKREALVVREFAASDEESENVSIVAEAAPGQADAMASAAASVALWLLDAGVEIDLATPAGRLSGVSPGESEEVLGLFARAGAGRVANARRDAAGIVVVAERDGPTIATGGETIPFDRLVPPGATAGGIETEASRANTPAGSAAESSESQRRAEGRAATAGGLGGER